MHRDVSAGLLLAGLALLLAACSSPAASEPQRWVGTTTAGTATHPLAVDVALGTAGAWTGTYTVERSPAFRGDVDGTLVGGTLRATLTASPDCRFDLVGTVDGDTLTATYEPTACAGGESGTWSATREEPVPAASTDPSSSAGTFDDAAFDGARFH